MLNIFESVCLPRDFFSQGSRSAGYQKRQSWGNARMWLAEKNWDRATFSNKHFDAAIMSVGRYPPPSPVPLPSNGSGSSNLWWLCIWQDVGVSSPASCVFWFITDHGPSRWRISLLEMGKFALISAASTNTDQHFFILSPHVVDKSTNVRMAPWLYPPSTSLSHHPDTHRNPCALLPLCVAVLPIHIQSQYDASSTFFEKSSQIGDSN